MQTVCDWTKIHAERDIIITVVQVKNLKQCSDIVVHQSKITLFLSEIHSFQTFTDLCSTYICKNIFLSKPNLTDVLKSYNEMCKSTNRLTVIFTPWSR